MCKNAVNVKGGKQLLGNFCGEEILFLDIQMEQTDEMIVGERA